MPGVMRLVEAEGVIRPYDMRLEVEAEGVMRPLYEVVDDEGVKRPL